MTQCDFRAKRLYSAAKHRRPEGACLAGEARGDRGARNTGPLAGPPDLDVAAQQGFIVRQASSVRENRRRGGPGGTRMWVAWARSAWAPAFLFLGAEYHPERWGPLLSPPTPKARVRIGCARRRGAGNLRVFAGPDGPGARARHLRFFQDEYYREDGPIAGYADGG